MRRRGVGQALVSEAGERVRSALRAVPEEMVTMGDGSSIRWWARMTAGLGVRRHASRTRHSMAAVLSRNLDHVEASCVLCVCARARCLCVVCNCTISK